MAQLTHESRSWCRSSLASRCLLGPGRFLDAPFFSGPTANRPQKSRPVALLLEHQVAVALGHTGNALNPVEDEILQGPSVRSFDERDDVWQAPTNVGRLDAVETPQLFHHTGVFPWRYVYKDIGFHGCAHAVAAGAVGTAARLSSSHSATSARKLCSSWSHSRTTSFTTCTRTPMRAPTTCFFRRAFSISRTNASGSPEIARARKQSLQLCPVALRPRVTRSGPSASKAVVKKTFSSGFIVPSSRAFSTHLAATFLRGSSALLT